MPPGGGHLPAVADQQAAMAQLVASARALADAPIWVLGPGPVIDAALAAPQLGRAVSGVVMTSVASDSGSCSESFFYSDRHRRAAKSRGQTLRGLRYGHARDWRAAAIGASGPAPANQPRLIEASAVATNLQPGAKVRHLAELIKSTPPG